MFSSDPRVRVGSLTRRWQNVAVWILKIGRIRKIDEGLYQCQVFKAIFAVVFPMLEAVTEPSKEEQRLPKDIFLFC